MKQTICALCILLITSHVAQALSYSTAEGCFASSIAQLSGLFAGEHEGQAPKSWSDIQAYLDRPIDKIYYYVLPTKRYAFMARPLQLPPPHEGELIIVTRRPFHDSRLYTNWFGGISGGLREAGRYIVYRRNSGEFESSYVDEAYIEKVFRGSESLMPAPDTEPERRHERNARWHFIINWGIFAVIATFVVARRYFRYRNISSAKSCDAKPA